MNKTHTHIIRLFVAGICLSATARAMTFTSDPILSSWMRNSSDYAEVLLPGASAPSTSWPIAPGSGTWMDDVPSDVQAVYYTSGNVYIMTEGLSSYVMGPWYGPGGLPFPNYPEAQGEIAKIPRSPLIYFLHYATPASTIGLWVNGTAVFNMINKDFGGYWHPDAYQVEGETFDPGNFHQEGGGLYHSHVNPVALRWQLGDHVAAILDGLGGSIIGYKESILAGNGHSPILGWAFDGIPIYGPYGYKVATDPGSGIARMRSGYTLRDGSNGSTDLHGKHRSELPYWAALAAGLSSTHLTHSSDWGPDVPISDTDPYYLGYYVEDWAYRGDLVGGGTLGSDYDLDRYNCRWCVTPEFPNGTYAYFVTIKDYKGTPAFPYTVGRQYFGFPFGTMGSGAAAPTIPGSATKYTGTFPRPTADPVSTYP